MAPLVRRSILKEFLIFACVATPLALAQHPIGRPTGGVVHPAAPPILRAPTSPAPDDSRANASPTHDPLIGLSSAKLGSWVCGHIRYARLSTDSASHSSISAGAGHLPTSICFRRTVLGIALLLVGEL